MKNWQKSIAAIGATAALGYLTINPSVKNSDKQEAESDRIADVSDARNDENIEVDNGVTATRVAVVQASSVSDDPEPGKIDWNDILNRIKQGDKGARDVLFNYVYYEETDAGTVVLQGRRDFRYPPGISEGMVKKIYLANSMAFVLSEIKAITIAPETSLDNAWKEPISYKRYYEVYTEATPFLQDDEFIRMIGQGVTRQELQDRFIEAQTIHETELEEIRSGKKNAYQLLIDVD